MLQPGILTATATNAPTAFTNLHVYPNPAHQTLQVQLPKVNTPVSVTLTSLLGQVLACPRQQSSGTPWEASFSLAGIVPGIYWVEVICQDNKYHQRLVIL